MSESNTWAHYSYVLIIFFLLSDVLCNSVRWLKGYYHSIVSGAFYFDIWDYIGVKSPFNLQRTSLTGLRIIDFFGLKTATVFLLSISNPDILIHDSLL